MIRLRPIEDALMHDIDRGRRRLSDIDRLTRRETLFDVKNEVDGPIDNLAATTIFGLGLTRSTTMIGGSISSTPDSTENDTTMLLNILL